MQTDILRFAAKHLSPYRVRGVFFADALHKARDAALAPNARPGSDFALRASVQLHAQDQTLRGFQRFEKAPGIQL